MNKTKVLYIRIEERDLQLLQRAAEKLDIPRAKFVRAAIRQYADIILGGVIIGEGEKDGTGETAI